MKVHLLDFGVPEIHFPSRIGAAREALSAAQGLDIGLVDDVVPGRAAGGGGAERGRAFPAEERAGPAALARMHGGARQVRLPARRARPSPRREPPRRPGAGRSLIAALAALLALGGAASPAPAQPPGEIHGAVRLARDVSVPPAITVLNTTDPAACGRVHALQEILVSEPARGVRDAILALEGVPAERVPPRPPGRLVIDNTRCRFEPRVAVATVGGTLEALNRDPVLHTVHLYGALEANLGLPRKGARLTRRLERPGMIVVKCDVHGWMQAYIRVDPHPFHAVTDDQGSFRIRAVPPGEYTLDAWHETLGTLRRTVTVRSQRTTTVDFEYAGASRSRGE